MEIGILPRVRSDRMRMNLASEEDFGISKPAAPERQTTSQPRHVRCGIAASGRKRVPDAAIIRLRAALLLFRRAEDVPRFVVNRAVDPEETEDAVEDMVLADLLPGIRLQLPV